MNGLLIGSATNEAVLLVVPPSDEYRVIMVRTVEFDKGAYGVNVKQTYHADSDVEIVRSELVKDTPHPNSRTQQDAWPKIRRMMGRLRELTERAKAAGMAAGRR